MKKRRKKIIIIISLVILSLIFLLIVLNLVLRKSFNPESYENDLSKLFGEGFLNDYSIKIYEKGIFQTFSSLTICNSIYLKKPSLLDETDLSLLLVHESTHVYQAKKVGCIRNSFSSLFHQFKAFLSTGSRGNAYFYLLKQPDNYNPEQEATIIEDYYYLKFLEGNESYIYCLDCQYYEKGELVNSLEEKYLKIIEKYN